MFRPFSPSPPPWHARRARPLSLEHLEARVVLSGVPEVAATLPAIYAAVPADPSALVAMTSVVVDGASGANTPPLTVAAASSADSAAGLAQVATLVPEMLPPVTSPADNGISPQTSGGSATPFAAPLGPPGQGGAPNMPPWIFNVTADLDNGIWRIHGSVLDDASPAGLSVHFSGILNARTITDDFGNFEFTIADSELGMGWLYVQTVDASGLASDYEQVTIDR